MSYTVKIRKNETGEVVEYEMKDCDYDSEETLWFWTDGNFVCDCNRELSFDRAKKVDREIEEYRCSEGRFSVLLPGEKDWV